jgi:ubiquitin carboxyl-terminal hydrolase 1
MSYGEYPELDAYQQRWNTADSHPSTTSLFLGVILGVYILFKSLDYLGFPAGFYIRRIFKMAAEVLRSRASSFSSVAGSESSDGSAAQNGGMLGSLFGMSPGSLLQKGVRGMASALSMGSGDAPPGLGNISNSCYQNSVIQGLASLPSLRDYLEKTTSEHPSLSPESTNGALFEIITQLNDPENKGRHFWIRGKLKSMSTFEQQDAQEYYSKILDALDEEVKKTASSKRRSSVSWLEVTKVLSDSPSVDEKTEEGAKDDKEKTIQAPPNPLEGRLAQRVGCTVCGYSEGLTLIPFNCITVSLGKNHGYDIRECLDEYTTLEFIDGVECAKCTLLKLQRTLTPLIAAKPESPLKSRLDAVQEALEKEDFEDKTLLKTLNVPKKNWVQSTKSKQAVVARAPQSLVLHVNRSSFNEYTGMPFKNTAGVSYPSVLDLGNWCLGGALSGSQQPVMSEEEWPRDPRESMLPKGQPMSDSPFQYRLRAAVTHYGSHGNGHYVCYRSHPKTASQPSESEAVDVSSADEKDKDNKDNDSEDDQEQQTREDASAPPSEQWWRFSDDSVYPVSEQEAHQGNVFMLFYERIDESSPVSTPSATESATIAEDAPLPPVDVTAYTQDPVDEEAISIALPDDEDNLMDHVPAKSTGKPQQPQLEIPPIQELPELINETSSDATTTPTELSPPQSQTELETEASDAESEDAPSTQLTSDSEADAPTPLKSLPVSKISPNMMRTAGNTSSRGQRKRQSLPLVSAT